MRLPRLAIPFAFQPRHLLWQGLVLLWMLVAFYHFPFGGESAEDAVGLYDIVCVLFTGLFLFRWLIRAPASTEQQVPDVWQFLLLYGLWLVALGLSQLANPGDIGMFSALLLIKQFQFLAGLFVSCQLLLMLDARTASRLLDVAMFILLTGAWYFYITHWWNLPLPYHEGSGAVMGAIVFLYTLWVMQTKSLKSPVVLVWIGFLLISGFMTMGRTQVLAFVVAMGVYTSGQMLVHNTPGRMMAIVSGIVAVAVAFYVVFYTDVLGVDFYGGNPLQYLNVNKLLDDPSFAIRYYKVWPFVFSEWTENPIVRFFFGFGLGRERYVDGLYINLIVSTGLFGVLAFTLLNIWLFLVLPRFRVVMVFLWISGLTGEILLHSYRFHQFLMIIGVMFFLYTPHARQRLTSPSLSTLRPVAAA